LPASCDDGGTIVRLEDGSERMACLFAYLEGERPTESDVAAAMSLGEATGALLGAMADLEPDDRPAYAPYYEMESSYPLCATDQVAAFCDEPPTDLQDLSASLTWIREELAEFRSELPRFRSLPHQWIHGDINFSNCLTDPRDGSRIGAILDFEFCAWDLRAMEIAVVVSGFLNEDNGKGMIEAFLRGAGGRIRLGREERQAIPMLVRLRSLDVFLHFLNRYMEGVDGTETLREQTVSVAQGLRKLKDETRWLTERVERYLTP